MNWRELIHRFLTACAEDDHGRSLVAAQSRRNKFIQEYGAENLRRNCAKRIEANLALSNASLGSPDDYRLIEESSDLIVAEVDPGPNRQPYRLTRFRVANRGGRLELVDYFWKCGVCDDGNCKWCNGSGLCHMCDGVGVGVCDFCDADSSCAMCEGTRACSMCKDGEMPGWRRMSD